MFARHARPGKHFRTHLETERLLGIDVVVGEDVLLHPEALPNAVVIGKRPLLGENAQVDNGHIGVVKRLQHIRLAEVQALELQGCQVGGM